MSNQDYAWFEKELHQNKGRLEYQDGEVLLCLSNEEIATLFTIYDYLTEQGEMANYIEYINEGGNPSDHIQEAIFEYDRIVGRIQGLPASTWDVTFSANGKAHGQYAVEDVPSTVANILSVYDDAKLLDIEPSDSAPTEE